MKILKVKPSRKPGEHYRADATLVWCFDFGFGNVFEKFVRSRKFKKYDIIAVGGGAKALADAKDKIGREFLLRQVQTSVKLHHSPLVILMMHSDCGAYGGLKAFKNDCVLELKKHKAHLRAAKKFLYAKLPRFVKIEKVFADFNCVRTI